VGATLDFERIPRATALRSIAENEGKRDLERDCVLSGGDDYELVFTADPRRRDAIAALSAELKLPLSRIGTIHAGDTKLVVLGPDGAPMEYRSSFDHFGDAK